MIRKSSLSHAANISLGSYVVAPSLKVLSRHLREEPSLQSILHHETPSLFLCIDKNVPLQKQEALIQEVSSFYKRVETYHLDGGDGAKTWDYLERLIDYAFSRGVNQSWHIAAFGGGALSDLVGFFSSIYMRGCPLILFPSTLLSMTDAALGGKNGINFKGIKNFIGSLTFPAFVYSSVDLLDEFSQLDILQSSAEMWKHALLHSKEAHTQFISLFSRLSQSKNSISHDEWVDEIFFNTQVKMSIASQALNNPEKRHLLNLGHTVAHALEAASHGKMPHGIAVFYGIIAEGFLGKKIGIVDSSFFDEIYSFFDERVRSVMRWSDAINVEIFRAAMEKDKKNISSKPAMVFLRSYGLPFECGLGTYRYNISEEDVDLLIAYLKRLF